MSGNPYSPFDAKPYIPRLPMPTLDDMGVPFMLQEAEFDKCHQTPERIEKLKFWSRSPKGILIFAGSSGRGKSYASVCCIKEYRINGGKYLAKFANVPRLCLDWKEHIASSWPEIRLLEKIERQELLVIDDIGQREPSPAFQDFLYLIIDSRMNKNLGTIFTTNFSVGLLRERFGDPIVSRICSGEVLKFDGEDKRAALF